MKNVYAIIMAGGVGSRFWPLSRSKKPKQLLPLGNNKETLIESSVRRIESIIPPDHIFIVTGKMIADEVKKVLPKIPSENFLIEPEGKNTAPCIGWAALHIKNLSSDSVMIVLPSDHFIGDENEFNSVIKNAVNIARNSFLVTIGIIPDRPETGYGYIEIGDSFENVNTEAKKVIRFVEKPDLTTAQLYVTSQKYYWNSGMFIFKTETILNEIKTYLPQLHTNLMEIDISIKEGNENEVVEKVFPQIKPISIDYGVMEKSKNIAVIPGSFGWSDVGSWSSVYELVAGGMDTQRNVAFGELISIDSNGCLSWAPQGKIVAVIGVEDLVIIDTKDALLVCPKDRSQQVREIVDKIKKEGKNIYL